QFFITLAPAPELQRKNTMFGVVVGQSLFTALKLGESEVDKATERPVHPRTILSARVLDNPFSDIVPRSRPAQSLKSEDARPGSKLTKTKVIKAVKNKKLLSFADDFDDDFDDENGIEDGDKAGLYQGSNGKSKEDARNAKQQHAKRRFNMKSSHDLLDSDPMLSGRTLAPSELPASAPADAKHPQSPTRFTEAFVAENAKVEKTKEKQAAQSPRIGIPAHASDVVSDRIKRVESEINELASREGKRKRGQESDAGASEALDAKPSKSALSEMLAKYRPSKTVPIARRRKEKAHEDKLLERLSSFQSKIRKTKDSANGASAASLHGASAEKDAKCDLHSVSGC
ncbi:Peptidyl-prolyl isomerase cwc27, partial [Coemansia sp. RSA 2599]